MWYKLETSIIAHYYYKRNWVNNMLGCEKDEHIYVINHPIFRIMIEQVIFSYYDIFLQDYLILWFLHLIKLLIIWYIKCKFQSNLMSNFSSKFNIRSIWCYKNDFVFVLMKRQLSTCQLGTHGGRPKLKMVTNCFRTIIFMRPMRRLDMHLGRHNFCLLGFGRVRKGVLFFFCSQCVPIKFPKAFPKYHHTFIPYTMAKVELVHI